MSRTRCDDPANGMLAWYVNGSLEGAEERAVRGHVEGCAVCTEEADFLSRLERSLEARAIPVIAGEASPTPRRAPIRLAYALAAALLLPAGLGIWWAVLGFPGSEGVSGTSWPLTRHARRGARNLANDVLRAGVVLEIRGRTRGDEATPSFSIPPGAEQVTIAFAPPVDPDARFSVALTGPGGAVLVRRDGPLVLDAMGRSAFVVPSALLQRPAAYAVVVEMSAPAGAKRRYEYPFGIVRPPASGRD